jgi:hypothetical protein
MDEAKQRAALEKMDAAIRDASMAVSEYKIACNTLSVYHELMTEFGNAATKLRDAVEKDRLHTMAVVTAHLKSDIALLQGMPQASLAVGHMEYAVEALQEEQE